MVCYFHLDIHFKDISHIISVLGSKLDINSNSATCRLAFHGQLLEMFEAKDYHLKELPGLKIYKEKSKTGVVERASNDCEVICKSMFKKETNLALFTGLKVALSTGEKGVIEDSFGQSGKFKVRIPGKHAQAFHVLHIVGSPPECWVVMLFRWPSTVNHGNVSIQGEQEE